MVDTEVTQALQADIPPTQSAPMKPAQNIFLRIVLICFAIVLILFGVMMLLYIISKLPNDFGLLNQLIYHTKYIGIRGQLSLFQLFFAQICTLTISLLFIISGFLIILRKPNAKILLLAAIFVLLIQSSVSAVIQLKTSQDNKRAEEQFLEKIKNVDKSTVTDMSIIWKLNEPQLCKNIKSYYQRNNCVTEIGDTFFTPDFCDDFQGDERNLCLSDSAAAQKDKEVCYTIQDNFRKNYCIAGVAAEEKDLQLCDEVIDVSLYKTCIANVAIELRDSTVCELVEDRNKIDGCFGAIATFTQDLSLCGKIVDKQLYDACILQVEVQLKK